MRNTVLAAYSILLLVLSGCLRSTTFRVVDASTGAPLASVQAEHGMHGDFMDFLMMMRASYTPLANGITDGDGRVRFGDIGGIPPFHGQDVFQFSASGYAPLTEVTEDQCQTSGWAWLGSMRLVRLKPLPIARVATPDPSL